MTRPGMIRADTIDLQDRDAPSAKDHTQIKTSTSTKDTLSSSSSTPSDQKNLHLASHQAETLRGVAAETAQDRRISWTGSNLSDLHIYGSDLAADISDTLNLSRSLQQPTPNHLSMTGHQQQDALAIAQNGGDVVDEDMEDIDDEELEDDMMDKISSSPSIEDGNSQASKTPPVSPDGSAFRQHRRHRSRYDTNENTPPWPLNYDEHIIGPLVDPACSFARSPAKAGLEENDFSKGRDLWDVSDDVFDEMMIPYYHDDDDGDDNASGGASALDIHDNDVKFVISGWGSECLHNIEDIDFEFVYALHTFMATVEGQANATKGDTMVLLDDSNSYWWLVRVVKDSSIGYLPAEHIETPTERLARLNKHRNIDLSASMLGDQAEKTKNPLKSAMRRRKTKTVAFAPPTYVDYSDIDYSTDGEDLEAEYFAQQQQSQQQQESQEEHKEAAQSDSQQQGQQGQQGQQAGAMAGKDVADEEDETARVEPLKPRAPKENVKAAADGKTDDANEDGTGKGGLTRTSEEIFVVSKSETPGPKKTKDGTVRDSFFKDDTVETKKITLTPNLLRDDSAPRTSSESKDAKQRPSLDRLDKDINSLLVKDDKKKKDKKEKDKKAGGFRSLFSRKDKKRGENEDDESFGKRSMDVGSEGTERDLDEVEEEPAEEKASSPSTTAAPQQGPQRHPSKLQKQQPLGRIAEVSPTRNPSDGSTTQKSNGKDTTGPSSTRARVTRPEAKPEYADNVSLATMRMVDPDGAEDSNNSNNQQGSTGNTAASQATRPLMVTKAPARAVLDEFESDEEAGVLEPQHQGAVHDEEQKRPHPEQRRLEQQQQQQQTRDVPRSGDDSSASPVQGSPVNANHPPALMVDTSSQEEEEDQSSPISSPSPELVGSEDRSGGNHYAQDSITTSTSTTTANTATWNDASLRAFFDSGTDVRDLLVVVYDKSDVVPAGPDHPVVSTLFKEQNTKLAEITTQLDNMLGDWLARKQRLRGTL
ncbi:sh3 domain protein [Sporothrix brasiliensis 5110]|uniref:Sh3 domain protein n=1 Tax=Sporothrix brasiliensis 5110 TaxID=1398154 RepID=A0A0C2IZM5_9PEZI|nr:sh3 domain protein [Sporothrix brasiliensis 5110]KIH92175.1 sh3 domain protein [Sporothrix brasiliensis 5110]